MAEASSIQMLTSESDLESALDASQQEAVLLYKHSSTCPISARAQKEVKTLTEDSDPRVYEVVVQTAREVSDDIEEQFGIRHETPQAILVRDGKAVFDTSHNDVTAENVRGHLAGA